MFSRFTPVWAGSDPRHNYHELNALRRAWYRLAGHRRLSADDRFFFEGVAALPGQMYLAERKSLFEAVIARRPRLIVEIGTASGGGSTFFLASALARLGTGTLHTVEIDPNAARRASTFYRRRLPELARFVVFHQSPTLDVLRAAIEAAGDLDACFLDGSDDPDESLRQYEFLAPYMTAGAILMAHDWHTQKMSLLKPRMISNPEWSLLTQLELPDSVGFVVYRRSAKRPDASDPPVQGH